ncbi:MAG: sigma-70 family RNA polymerase sigma factor [Bacteroidales bacterium]|jgi:RNA polymerase sigma-70 factor (ECF subfamily)|nr:sigma-70 family RNA polymerase sigma factor [Bacteroidales bacterium]
MIPKETEYELVRSVLNGEKERFAIIVKEYQEIVNNLSYKLVGNKLDAEEVVQQVFVELYTSLPRFRFESKLSTFIYRITFNVITKMLGKNGRYVSYDNTILENRPSGPTAEEKIMKEEQRRKLRQAIGNLKYEQRTALVLFTYDEFTYNEIAEVMQVSLSKVESLIFRAKKNLRKMME